MAITAAVMKTKPGYVAPKKTTTKKTTSSTPSKTGTSPNAPRTGLTGTPVTAPIQRTAAPTIAPMSVPAVPSQPNAAAVSPASTGVGSGTGTPFNNQGTSQTATSFGDSFNPAAYQQLWEDPEGLIRAYFNYKKFGSNTGSEAMLQQLQPSMGIQWMLGRDAGSSTADPSSTANYLDWVGRFLQQQGTPGGQSFDPAAMIHTLLNPQGDELKQQLTGDSLTKGDQVNNMLSAYKYAMQPGLPTPVLNAMLAKLESLGTDFRSNGYQQQVGAPTDQNFLQFLKTNKFGV